MAKTNIRGAQIADGANGVNLTVDVTGTLPVPNGGTGATTLTGYLKGNGTSAVTASSSIPVSDLGTGKVVGSDNGTPTSLTIWVGSEAEYDAIGTKDANTIYFRTA